MKGILLMNPAAGRLRDRPALVDLAAWEQRFRAVGMDVQAWRVPGRRMRAAALRAVASDAQCVIAAGGDGTVRTVAEVLVGRDKPLGVLPAGTLNHFARDLGLPAEPEAAVPMLAAGTIDRIDVGEVNGQVFVNNSSVGLYSQMVLERDALRPCSRRRKFVAMFRAFVRVLRRFPRLTATLHHDGTATTCTVPLILVSNNPYQTGWPQLGRRPDLNRGLFGVYVVLCASRFGLLRCIARATTCRLDGIPSIRSFVASDITIATHHHTVHVSLDGEVLRLTSPLVYRSRARELLVIRPPG